MEGILKLEPLSEKTLPQTVDAHLLVYCPSMDLVALGSIDQQVLIYRLNGQRVYGATQKAGTLRVEAIQWKPNGQLLAIAWSDGSVRLVGAESSKTVHQFSTGTSISGVTCMAWTSNFANKKSASMTQKNSVSTWESHLPEGIHDSTNKAALDLPRDLSLIDIEISLPKLSVLANGGSSEEVFSSRASLDALFQPFDPKDDDSVDVMVIGTREGNIHLSIYDSFVVGSFTSPVVIGGVPSHLVLHASHQQYSTHSLLMKSSYPEESVYFVPMDLRFVSASSRYLSLLASRSTALQNLLRYIQQVQILMISEWKSTQELPSRFLRNINDTLEENGNRNIVQALYHSVATGHTYPSVREWLVDELTERGHKRWDKAVITGLESLKRLVHENMLPALDRCTVILSRFMGIAKFQGANNSVGFSSHQINLIMDTVACLHLVSSRILIEVVDELDHFVAFSSWLRYEIDRLASEASSSINEEAAEKEASIDHSKVLHYLQTTMTSNPLAVFFDETSVDDHDNLSQVDQGLPMFDLLEKQLEKQEQGLPYIKPLTRVQLLCKYLVGQSNAVFKQIAEAEKRNVLFGRANELGVAQEDAPMDIRMSKKDHSFCYSYVALIPRGLPNQVRIFKIELSIENGISTVRNVESHTTQVGDGRVKDIKFVDDNILLLLWERKGVTYLLSVPYRSSESSPGNDYQMEFYPHNSKSSPPDVEIMDDEHVLELFLKHKIVSEESFVPEKMEVRESNGKNTNADSRRVVILSRDKLRYKVFKLPSLSKETNNLEEDIVMS